MLVIYKSFMGPFSNECKEVILFTCVSKPAMDTVVSLKTMDNIIRLELFSLEGYFFSPLMFC